MEEEYTIIEEPRKRPSHYPEGFRFSFETPVDEKAGEYNLEAYDDHIVNNMVKFVNNGYVPFFSPDTFEKIIKRSQANNAEELLPVPIIFKALDEDVVSGAIMMCRQLYIALCGCYNCDPNDPVDAMCSVMKAVGDKTITRKEYEIIKDMLEFRRIASFRLDVEPPSAEQADGWFETTMKVISRCYDFKVGNGSE